jgi:hypothetical protein
VNDYGAEESCNFWIIVGKDLSQLHILSKIEYKIKITSVADLGCLSRIPDLGLTKSRIPDQHQRIR